MSRIISIIDLFDQEHEGEREFFRDFGFDIKMDFKELRSYKMIEQYRTILNSLPIEYELQGDKVVLYRGRSHKILKMYFRDESRNASKIQGFRVICLCRTVGENVLLIPFHIYMHQGARGKSDLTENEKKLCRDLIMTIER